jgi:hypothetical protein
MPEEENNVLRFRPRDIQRINGIKMDLGRLSTLELQILELQCEARFVAAHNELEIIRRAVKGRLPGGGDQTG